MLKEVFENPEFHSFFNITQPNQEYIYDLYVANCAQKVLHQGNYGTNGQFTYPGWKIINCGEQGCCKHTYKVVYRHNCNANPQCLKLDWYNKELLKNSKINSNVYIYEVKDATETKLTGKLLIK